jgi:hypothetical protein
MKNNKALMASLALLLMVLALLGSFPKNGFSFCSDCSEKKDEVFDATSKETFKDFKIEYSNPVFLDVENLHRNRTIYVVLVNFNVKKGLEERIRKDLFDELKKVGMAVVSDPRQGAYLMGLFLKKIDKDEVEVDVLIRERYEIKGLEGKPKIYSSDLDSVDHLTTVKVKRKTNDKEEDKVFEKLIENLANFFKIS